MDIEFRESTVNDLKRIVELAENWENEEITYGYIAGNYDVYNNMTIWVGVYNNIIVAYLAGLKAKAEGQCIFPLDIDYFNIEEFYVSKEFRGQKIGSKMFSHVELELCKCGIEYILLSTATKDMMNIHRFYDNQGLDMWTMTYFKKLKAESVNEKGEI